MKTTSIALDKLDDWFKLAKPGDLAIHFGMNESLYYLYIYTEADYKPYWNLFRDVETAQAYIDAHFGKKEEPKMNKRCENCKHFAFVSGVSYCKHEGQAGTWVPKFTCCDKHEPKEEKVAPFDNLKFYIKDTTTGEVGIKYICEDCGKIMERPDYWYIKLPIRHSGETPKRPGYYYYCEECNNKKEGKV